MGLEFVILIISMHFLNLALNSCEAKAVGLVRYPNTQAPASGTQSVTTRCAGETSP